MGMRELSNCERRWRRNQNFIARPSQKCYLVNISADCYIPMRGAVYPPGENNIPSRLSIVFGRKQRIAENWSDSKKEEKWLYGVGARFSLSAKRRRRRNSYTLNFLISSILFFIRQNLVLEIVYRAKTAK